MFRTNAATAIALSTGLCLAASTAQAVTFFDGIFNNSDWSLTTISNAAGAGSTASGLQFLTGGNPNEYRRIRHQLVVGSQPNGGVFSFHMKNTAFYTPSSQGAISYIDYSEDSINFVNQVGNGQGSGLAIYQNGRFYRQQNPILVMPYAGYSSWTANPSLGLLAADFAEVTLAGLVLTGNNPDFSAAGTIMQLGFVRSNSGNGSYNTDCGIDNWHVNVVPAPASAAMLGLGGLMAARRRR